MRLITKKITTLFLCILSFIVGTMAQTTSLPLTQWRLSCPDPADTAYSTSIVVKVPGCLHTDLFDHGLIPDPFYGTNEESLQWLSYVPCTYSCEFWRDELPAKKNIELVLAGVTGYAEIFLNGQPLEHQDHNNVMDNAYRTWRFPLDKKIRTYNLIEVRFTPAQQIIDHRKAAVPYALPEERAWLRMPPYQSGWDWGPKLTTCGIMGEAVITANKKSIYCPTFNLPQTSHPYFHTLHSYAILSKKGKGKALSYSIKIDGKIFTQSNSDDGFRLPSAASVDYWSEVHYKSNTEWKYLDKTRWEPNGSGNACLHDVVMTLQCGKKVDSLAIQAGFRSVELRQTKDSIGQSFEFVINGKPVFVKGVNWIPADFFPHRMTEDRYRELLQACKDANVNMIRVWGGGIYEPDIFYDLCDEMGIMVWQDFMFAGTLYPGDSSFIQNVQKEAVEQVLRLRRHPCIVLWCGTNEVKNGWEDWGWKNNYTPEQREQLDRDMHYLFDTLLAKVVKDFGGGVPYIPTSPLWGWGHSECCTEGDSHYWGVWWGEQPFEMWYSKTGRFMSEYGFQSYPDVRTLQTVMPDTALHLGSAELNNHQKHARGVQIIDKAMNQYFYRPDNLEDYVYVSQLVQAYGIGMALEEHRRRSPYCMGTLMWQLNDCWPVASWSCIDYYGRRKALYYEMKRQFKPIIIACDTMQEGKLPIYVVSDHMNVGDCCLTLSLCRMDGTVIEEKITDYLEVSGNRPVHFIDYTGAAQLDSNDLRSCYLRIKCHDITQKVKFFCYPGQLELPEAEITVRRIDDTTVEVSSTMLQYGVELSANVDGYFEDNYFTLLPNEPKQVKFVPKEAIKGNVVFSARGYRNMK